MSSNGIIGTFLLKDLQDHEKYSCYMLYVELFDKKEKILKYTKIPKKICFSTQKTQIKNMEENFG